MTLAASSLNRVSRKVSAKHCQQTLLAFFLAAFTISCDERHQSQNVESKPKHLQTVTINNIEPRRDVAGRIIDAHDGCLQFFNGRFYLYGMAYGTNESSLALNCPFRVYSSPDLERWTYEGELLKDQPTGVYTRPSVVFNPHTHKYVLWYNWFPKLWDGQDAVATSDTPVGPFTIVNLNVPVFGSRPGDGSLLLHLNCHRRRIRSSRGVSDAGLPGFGWQDQQHSGQRQRSSRALPAQQSLLRPLRTPLW
jgi:hypothetical protein